MRNWIVGAVFVGLGATYWWTQNQSELPGLEVPIFDFEKQSLQEVVIHQPGQEVRMVEKNGTWVLVQADNEASTTMVNRSKHQLHRLKARSIVERNPTELNNYGLGKDAIQVDLSIRGGQKESLLIGGANPTGVSYYMMPLSGPHKGSVVTVAKASVDFFGSELGDFRAEHFVQFDLQSVDAIEIALSESFVTKRKLGTGVRTWSAKRSTVGDVDFWKGGFTDESSESISKDFMRRLLGRYLALKAKEYKGVVEVSDAESGLGEPLVSIQLQGSGVDLQLQIGKSVSDGLRYFSVSGLTERVIARDGLLEDYNFSVEMTRNPLVLDYMDDIDGVLEIHFDGVGESSSLLHNEDWVLNGGEVSEDLIKPLIQHLGDFRVANWGESGKKSDWEFVLNKDNHLPRGVKLTHTLGTTVLTFGEQIEKNMALSDSEPPQIVQYRQVRIQSVSTEVDVLIEEHWLSELIERHDQLFKPTESGE